MRRLPVFQLILQIVAPAHAIPAMIQALDSVMFEARLERGLVDCRLCADAANPRALRYVEEWDSERALERQLRSPRFGTLLSLMETASTPPTLEIRTISDCRGWEYVRAKRLGEEAVDQPTPPAAPGG
jgi:quinol monooxygenase YgiN